MVNQNALLTRLVVKARVIAIATIIAKMDWRVLTEIQVIPIIMVTQILIIIYSLTEVTILEISTTVLIQMSIRQLLAMVASVEEMSVWHTTSLHLSKRVFVGTAKEAILLDTLTKQNQATSFNSLVL